LALVVLEILLIQVKHLMVLTQSFQQSHQLVVAVLVVLETTAVHQADQVAAVVNGTMEAPQVAQVLLIKATQVVMVLFQVLTAVWVAVAVALAQLAQMVIMVKVVTAVLVLQYP
jgi:hypothetical protein